MEDGVKDIKDTHAVRGPKIDWEYYKTLHPVIPVAKAVIAHVEQEFSAWTRYSSHTTSTDRSGILALQNLYRSECVYHFRSGRELHAQSKPADFVNSGMEKLPDMMKRWVDGRDFERSVQEDFCEESDSDSEAGSHIGDEEGEA